MPHGGLGNFAQARARRGLLAGNHNREGRVAVPAIQDGAAVERHQIPRLEHPLPRDSVDDLLVDRDADLGRIAVIAVEVRSRSVGLQDLAGELVHPTRRHPGANLLAQRRMDRGHDQTRLAHAADLAVRLVLQGARRAGHQAREPRKEATARPMRSATSSTSPMPSTLTRILRARYSAMRGSVV